MEGRVSLLRPHSLTTTKPVIIIPGQLIVYQMVHEIYKVVNNEITDNNPTFVCLGDYYHLQLRWIS